MVNILVAPDKFKGSLTATEVCRAVKEGLLESGIEHTLIAVPLADGGEGTCDLLTQYFKGTKHTAEVNGPLFTPAKATYGISGDGKTAFIEMAQASGLQLIAPAKRDPLLTSTFGTGELIREALRHQVDTIIMGIGGSATNDAGIGMAAALGYEFFDKEGTSLKPVGQNLIRLHSIRDKNVLPGLRKTKFMVLCDVTNPLYGDQGAAYTYGLQKGATTETLPVLDAGLRNFEVVARSFFKTSADFPGAGAAGGLGAGARLFLRATLHQGMAYIIKVTDLEKKIQASDLIITGEGKLDDQSLSGKVVMEIARISSGIQKPVIAVCGKNELPDAITSQMGIRAVLSLTADGRLAKDAIDNAYDLIKKQVAGYFAHR